MGFRDELLAQLPALVFGTLAGKLGGPQAVGAFQRGQFQRGQYEDAQARQAMLDAERQQQYEDQQARQDEADSRADAAATRAEEDQKRQRLTAALAAFDRYTAGVGDTAGDPVAAENDILKRASLLEPVFGLPQGQLSGFVPNMAPIVTRGVRADARQLLADAETKAAKLPGATVDESVSFTWGTASPRLQGFLKQAGHAEGQPFKPAQIREIAGSPTITAPTELPPLNTIEGQQISDAFAAAEEAKGAPLTRAERKQIRLAVIGEISAARRDDSTGRPYFIPVQTGQGIQSFNTRTGGVVGRVGDLKPGETAQREIANAQTIATVLDHVLTTVPDTVIGPLAGRYKTVEAALAGNDPTFATFAAAVATLQNTVINLRTGAQMSEPEARRILGEVPNVNLPLGTFVARAKQSQRYFKEWLKNRASVAYGRTTTGDVDRMITPPQDWVEVEPDVEVRPR